MKITDHIHSGACRHKCRRRELLSIVGPMALAAVGILIGAVRGCTPTVRAECTGVSAILPDGRLAEDGKLSGTFKSRDDILETPAGWIITTHEGVLVAQSCEIAEDF